MLPLIRRLRKNDEPIAKLPTRVAFWDVSTVNAVDPFVVVITAPFADGIFTLDVPLAMVVTEGADQVASPRQKVVADALVPLFKLVTGRFPVTPVVNGNPVALVRVAETGVPRAVMFPEALSCGDRDAAIVSIMFLVPAEKVTAEPELEEL